MRQQRTSLTRGTLTAQLVGSLREEIISGELDPGARLRVEDIAQRYGVSHTPIREALRSLAAEGFVRYDPRLGAEVAAITREDLHDVYRLRILLEAEALRSAIEHGDAAWESRVASAMGRLREVLNRRGSSSQRAAGLALSERHRAFDTELLSACDSPRLLALIETMSTHSERYRWVLRTMRGLGRDIEGEHTAIAEAALARDVPAALVAHEQHLRRSLQLLDESLDDTVFSTGRRGSPRRARLAASGRR